jgi:hypothetical protein
MLSGLLSECILRKRLDMYIGDKEIGEGWESMSCPFCDGFIVVWEAGVGSLFDPTLPFAKHMKEIHQTPIPDLTGWRRKRF